MAKNRKKQPTNLVQGIPRLGGEFVNRLNALDAEHGNLGTLLAQELNHRFNITDVRIKAGAGHAGTVVLAEQPRDSAGNRVAAMDLQNQNVSGSAWATQGDQLTPLSQVRSLFTCDHFGGHPSGFPGWFEECVRQEEVPRVSGGVIPWFFGYTVHPPAEADTLFVDAGTFGPVYIWPMILPETAIVTRLAYYLKDVVPPSTVGTKFNFGLYNRNLDLVCETGQQIAPAVGGVFVASLGDTITLPSGEYFYAFASNFCVWMLSIQPNLSLWRLLNNGFIGSTGSLTRASFTFDRSATPWIHMPDSLAGLDLEDGPFYVPIGLFEDDSL